MPNAPAVARFDVEGPANAQWLERDSADTTAAWAPATASPFEVYRGIQNYVIGAWQQGNPSQTFAFPPNSGYTGTIASPFNPSPPTGATIFAADGIVGPATLAMIYAILDGQTAYQTTIVNDMRARRISKDTMSLILALLRPGKSIMIANTAVMPPFGHAITGAPRAPALTATVTPLSTTQNAPPAPAPPAPVSTTAPNICALPAHVTAIAPPGPIGGAQVQYDAQNNVIGNWNNRAEYDAWIIAHANCSRPPLYCTPLPYPPRPATQLEYNQYVAQNAGCNPPTLASQPVTPATPTPGTPTPATPLPTPSTPPAPTPQGGQTVLASSEQPAPPAPSGRLPTWAMVTIGVVAVGGIGAAAYFAMRPARLPQLPAPRRNPYPGHDDVDALVAWVAADPSQERVDTALRLASARRAEERYEILTRLWGDNPAPGDRNIVAKMMNSPAWSDHKSWLWKQMASNYYGESSVMPRDKVSHSELQRRPQERSSW